MKEEKLLLIATETGGQSGLFDAIKTIIGECTDIADVEALATFDIEYVFLQIRTKSVGETVSVVVALTTMKPRLKRIFLWMTSKSKRPEDIRMK